MAMIPAGFGTKNDSAGEDQKQFTRHDPTHTQYILQWSLVEAPLSPCFHASSTCFRQTWPSSGIGLCDLRKLLHFIIALYIARVGCMF
jgi:hypothetical protein